MLRIWMAVIACLTMIPVTYAESSAANGLVVMLTDYGADSIYVGAIKGAMYTKNPAVRIDAISNSVPPFDVLAGAYMLAEVCGEFPAGTTFCCVVDPGVGTPRKCIVLETNAGQRFVAPDNGLLSIAAERFGVKQIREAANTAFWRAGAMSSTFHGRDVFGPVAAMLAGGEPLENAGPELKDLMRLEAAQARVGGGAAKGVVIREDTYGNLITNITAKDLEQLSIKPGETVQITIGKTCFDAPWKTTYADVPEGQKLVLIQSIGLLECAVNKGSLAKTTGEGLHAPVVLRKKP